jgi:hypothetical protein
LKMIHLDHPTAEAIEKEKALNIEFETLKLKLEEDRKFILQLQANSCQTLILNPSRFPVKGAEVEENAVFC